ncbi:helix-turn-helix transcriptional regulator [Leptothoe sp. PORK10 BA2]|uniref:helix-turn-helix transcriptional regulator n=1 Tax=Leptothoe sp. PORK10 BA2 TaxID=3110254 RepID=UPI002B1FCCA7|nr:LuxR C-terminal-related transcriptional regulator [Leptothoe sp. PORK10 BA2]MEA5462732.1 LuxR C-terminal-related transcriptional regulator [Leptothoe sp. PORK10 BA2]
MNTPAIQPDFRSLYEISSNFSVTGQEGSKKNLEARFLAELHQEFIDGILVFAERGELIYSNKNACTILGRLHQDDPGGALVPEEIVHICQSLTQSRVQFPHQNWLVELDIVTQDGAILHIRARWLNTNLIERPCLLLVLEDRQQAIASIVMEEAHQYGLTSREREVWVLHRNDLTYKQIAVELGITPHTVKKHMKNIHSKQKDYTVDISDFATSYPC